MESFVESGHRPTVLHSILHVSGALLQSHLRGFEIDVIDVLFRYDVSHYGITS
jgi:hypothetical protein